MNKIPNGLPTASNIQGSLPSVPSSRIVPFPIAAVDAKPLAPERLSLCDAAALYVTSLYELNKLVLLAVYSFFEGLFSGGASSKASAPLIIQKPEPQSQPSEMPLTPRPSVVVPFEVSNTPLSVSIAQTQAPVSTAQPVLTPPVVAEPEFEAEDAFDQGLYELFPTLFEYEKDQIMPTVLSRYLNAHLFKDKQSIVFDRDTNVFTMTFPARKEVPLIMGGQLKDKLRDAKLYLAQTVKVKMADGKLLFLDDSLMISCKIKPHVLTPEMYIAATVQSLADPSPFVEDLFEIAIKLNDEMNPIVKKGAQALCAVLGQDFNQIFVVRDESMRLLHKALYPQL